MGSCAISYSHGFYSLESCLGGVDHLKTHLGFHLEVKFQFLPIWIYFHWFFALYLVFSGRDMAEANLFTVKTVNIHQSKIDVEKFDDMDNFDMWRCEMMDR